MVPIVYCLDKNFVNYTKISIDSVLRHNPNARIELIVPEYIESLNQYKQHVCSDDMFEHIKMRDCDRITLFTYARLLIPELLSDYDKCLYIDGDVLVRTNLDELLNKDIPFIGAVEESNKDWLIGGIEKDIYYNAGVLLMNLDALRKENFSKHCLDFISNYKEQYIGKESTWLHDQTTINALYSDRITKLDKKYNDQLSWDPPTKYEDIVEEETNLHFLTDYNKLNFVKYAVERYRDFGSLSEDVSDVVLVLKDRNNSITNIDRTIQSILKCSEIYNNFKLHIFVKYRNNTLDRYIDKLDHDLVDIAVYDVTKLVYESDVFEYAKTKLNSKYTLIVDEKSFISKETLCKLIIHMLRFGNSIIFTKSKNLITNEDIHTDRPTPEIVRAASLICYNIKDSNVICLTDNFKKFDFHKSKVFPLLEFYNHEVITGKHGLSFDILSWFFRNPINYKRFSIEITFVIKRIFGRLGLYLNYNEALFLNPYVGMDPKYLTKKELHNIKRVRRSLESMTSQIKSKTVNTFDSKTLFRMFKDI
jgi:lipopolysaccharide biosynthesis glycosyltransferase